MFVVFEGIDGGGKTTLSNLVASRLRDRGLAVAHVREGGNFASTVTQAMRELGRDARNLALTPRAELMLYLTREVQLLEEATRPALAKNDVVIADRFVYTAEVLAIAGRRVDPAEVEPMVAAAAGGLVPDRVILVDVDPSVARARRKVSKLISGDVRPPSRKGLAGTNLQRTLREGYRRLAERDPERWIVVDNTEADLETLAELLATAIRTNMRPELQRVADPAPAAHDVESARELLLAWIERRSGREPGLAAYFLDGTYGPGFDERRRALADRVPSVIAAGTRWLDDPVSWELRHRVAEAAPVETARSIVGAAAHHADASALLARLIPAAPHAVAEALNGRTDDPAWDLRDRLPVDAIMLSVANVSDPRAWPYRERWLAARGGLELLDVAEATAACLGVAGVDDDVAWTIRKTLRGIAPVAAIESTIGLVDDRSWKWRERWIDRAPKVVMKSITGVDHPRAWALRDRVAAHCEEVLDTIIGMDTSAAWTLRERAVERWPASVLKSLGSLSGAAVRRMVAAALEGHPHDVAVWRQVAMRA